MGFIGVNPPAARMTADGATEQARLAATVDSAQKNMPGHIAFFKDSAGRISVLKYVQALASIVKGTVLMNVIASEATTGGVASDGLSQSPHLVTAATIGLHNVNMCKGIAAAEVSNTGYWFWAYIAGYCPDAAMPTSYASGQPMKLSGTYAGRLSSAMVNASLTCTGASGAWNIVAMSLGVSSSANANSTGSVFIQGWLG